MKLPSILEMLEAGVHFGHQSSRWHPKMKQFIFGERAGVHILDLEKTRRALEEVLPQITKMAEEGKNILFVSTKPQAKEIVRAAAERAGMPYLVDRWIGGLLTNFPEMKKMIDRYNLIKKQQAAGELDKYTKKEQLEIAKDLVKKDVSLVGLAGLSAIPDVIFVPALQREKTAVVEATKTGVQIIGIADSNANPLVADLAIPANDDAVKSITLIVNLVADAIAEGRASFVARQELAAKEAAAARQSARETVVVQSE